ncbi:Bro-N domain-containing protein [Pseudomonas nicosulfuronedens]|nr:Bro-N domain-containing protein [Pseudomonas nicosulfuronedens]MDH1007236.1 Bro-N domain-containing protein [Pseudomonas nicosulfuronedens]MDH1982081.1 Bro-N domain-containing protein [Pseudomonas nicosulfuronedens]MDH2026331.1 Bro-N domain-containing protein [Pseudomonas nicosulfuronedens]
MTPSTMFPANNGLSFHTFQRYDRFLRGLMIDRQAWFPARDLARLTNSDVSGRTTRKLDPDQYRWERLVGSREDELLVSESGLYTLLLVYFYHPENRNLRQWLSNDVVPVLRDAQLPTGSFPRHALREVQGYPLAVLEWQGSVWLRFGDAARVLERDGTA